MWGVGVGVTVGCVLMLVDYNVCILSIRILLNIYVTIKPVFILHLFSEAPTEPHRNQIIFCSF